MSRRVMPILGPDGRWRTMVETDAGPAVQIVDAPAVETSASWPRSRIDRVALDDLMRER